MADPAHPHLSVTGVAGLRCYGRGAIPSHMQRARAGGGHVQLAPAIPGGYGRGGRATATDSTGGQSSATCNVEDIGV